MEMVEEEEEEEEEWRKKSERDLRRLEEREGKP